jgi:hypothetical protein
MMQHSIKLSVLALSLTGLSLGSCSDDDAGVPGALGRDNRPDPGAQIDRAGRPAITAALVSTFSPATRDGDRDSYNISPGLGGAAPLKPSVESSLAILDGLNGTCGDQLLAGAGAVGTTRYSTLAGILLDDQIYVHTQDPQSIYLGLELEAAGAVSAPVGVGGGRAPGEDVIARSYSLLAAGAFGGIDDGVTVDDAVHDPNNFPFLAAP